MALTPEHIKRLQAESRFWDRFTYEELKTENGFKALFKPTAGGSNTAWQNSQAKISVIIQSGDGKFYKRDLGVFLIAGVETSLKSDTAVLRLESLAKPMQIASAEKVREAGQWYENVPLSFLINKLLESVYKGEDGLLPDDYSVARHDLRVETAGGQLEFWNLGIPPNWDGQTFRPSLNATPVTAMVSPNGTENIYVALGGTAQHPAELWLYEPADDIWTFIARTGTSHWPIQELIYNVNDGLLYGIMWKDRGESEATVFQNPNTWLSPPARIFWWNPELTVLDEYLDDPDKSLFVDKFFPGQWDVREMFPMTSLTDTPYYEGVEPDIEIPVDPEEPVVYTCPVGTAESFGTDVPREDVFAHTNSVQNIDFLYVNGLGWFASHITFTAPAESRLVRWNYNELTDAWAVASSFQLSANTTETGNLSYAAAKSMLYGTFNVNRIAKIDYTLETLTVNSGTDGAVANMAPIYIPTIDRVVSIVGISVVFFDPDTLAQTKILTGILNSGTARFVYHNPVTNTLIAATTRRIYEIDLTTDAVIKFAIYYEADPINSERKFWELDSWAPHGTDNQKLIARARHSWDYNYVSSATTNEIQAIGQTMIFTVNTLLDLRAGMKVYFDDATYAKGGAGEVMTYDAGTGYLQILLYNSYGTGSASSWYFNPDSFRYEIVEVDLVTGDFPFTFLTTNSVGDAEENAVQKIDYSPVTEAYYFSNIISNRNELFEFKPEDALATAMGEPGVANTVTAVRTEGIFSVVMRGYNVNIKHYGCIVPLVCAGCAEGQSIQLTNKLSLVGTLYQFPFTSVWHPTENVWYTHYRVVGNDISIEKFNESLTSVGTFILPDLTIGGLSPVVDQLLYHDGYLYGLCNDSVTTRPRLFRVRLTDNLVEFVTTEQVSGSPTNIGTSRFWINTETNQVWLFATYSPLIITYNLDLTNRQTIATSATYNLAIRYDDNRKRLYVMNEAGIDIFNALTGTLVTSWAYPPGYDTTYGVDCFDYAYVNDKLYMYLHKSASPFNSTLCSLTLEGFNFQELVDYGDQFDGSPIVYNRHSCTLLIYRGNHVTNADDFFVFDPTTNTVIDTLTTGAYSFSTTLVTRPDAPEWLFHATGTEPDVYLQRISCQGFFGLIATSTTPMTSSVSEISGPVLSDGTFVIAASVSANEPPHSKLRVVNIAKVGSDLIFTEEWGLTNNDYLGVFFGASINSIGRIGVSKNSTNDDLESAFIFGYNQVGGQTFNFNMGIGSANSAGRNVINPIGQVLANRGGSDSIKVSTTGALLHTLSNCRQPLAFDPMGNSYGVLGGFSNQLKKFNPSGTLLWTYPDANYRFYAYTFSKDSSTIYAVIYDENIGRFRIGSFRTSDGVQNYINTYEGITDFNFDYPPSGNKIVVYQGFLYVALAGHLRKFNVSNGSFVSSISYGGIRGGYVVKDTSGNLYVTKAQNEGGNSMFMFDTDLNLLAQGAIPGVTSIWAVDCFPGDASLYQDDIVTDVALNATSTTPAPESVVIADHLFGIGVVVQSNTPATSSSSLIEMVSPAIVLSANQQPEVLSINPYDSHVSVLHPSVLDMVTAWGGYRYWMAITPYTDSNDIYENPSIMVSNDQITWIPHPSITNPIAAYPGSGQYNSDPHIIHNPVTDEMWVYYRYTIESPLDDEIRLVKISNTFTVSAFSTLFAGGGAGDRILSPAVIRESATDWVMINIHSDGTLWRRTSTDGETWSARASAGITGIPETPWHIFMTKVGARYEAIIMTAAAGGALPTNLYFAYSTDAGLNFTSNPDPLLPMRFLYDSYRVYHSAFYVINGVYHIYQTGQEDTGATAGLQPWRIGYWTAALDGNILKPTQRITKPERYPVSLVDREPSYLRVLDYAAIAPQKPLTIEAWVRRRNTAQDTWILSKRTADGLGGYGMRIMNSGAGGSANRVRFTWFGVADYTFTSTSAIINNTNPNHVAVTISGTALRLFINGVFIQQLTIGNPNASTDPLFLGAISQGSTALIRARIDLDEIRIWSIARTDQQITDNYNLRFLGNETGLELLIKAGAYPNPALENLAAPTFTATGEYFFHNSVPLFPL